MLKKIFITLLFGLCHLFLPFVVSSCGGEDIPYDTQYREAEAETFCQANAFLTADCVDAEIAKQEAAANNNADPAEDSEDTVDDNSEDPADDTTDSTDTPDTGDETDTTTEDAAE